MEHKSFIIFYKFSVTVINVLLTEYDADLHLKETYEDGFAEGHEAGLAEGLLSGIKSLISSCRRHQIPKDTAIHDLMLDFSLSEQQAAEYMEKYW